MVTAGEGQECVAGPETLCLGGGRFRVNVDWNTAQGTEGQGQAVSLTSDTGYFWFFDSTNIELVIKVLDGCGVNQKRWVFAAGLTDVGVRLEVTDTSSGESRVYTNESGVAFVPIQDTSAFSSCP